MRLRKDNDQHHSWMNVIKDEKRLLLYVSFNNLIKVFKLDHNKEFNPYADVGQLTPTDDSFV